MGENIIRSLRNGDLPLQAGLIAVENGPRLTAVECIVGPSSGRSGISTVSEFVRQVPPRVDATELSIFVSARVPQLGLGGNHWVATSFVFVRLREILHPFNHGSDA